MKAKSSSSEISHMTVIWKQHLDTIYYYYYSDSSHVSQPDGVGYLIFFRGPTLCVLMRKTSVLFLSKAVRLLENQGNVKDVRNSIQTKRAVKKNKQSRKKRNLKLALWKRPVDAWQWDNMDSNPQSQAQWRASSRHNEFDPLSFIKREFLTLISICSPPLTVFYLSNNFTFEICSQSSCDATNDLPFSCDETRRKLLSLKGPRGNMKKIERKWQRA